jgi:hypothetical protein
MTAILLLLGLLSLGTLATRKGTATLIVRNAATPIAVGIGYALFSPDALAFLPPDTADGLLPAIRVGSAWQGLLLGLALRSALPATGRVKSAALTLAGWVIACAAMLIALELTPGATPDTRAWSGLGTIGAALLIAALVQGTGLSVNDPDAYRSADEVFAILVCLAVLAIPHQPTRPLISIALALMCAAALAMVAIGEPRRDGRLIALLGFVVLATGIAEQTRLPEVPITFLLGASLSITPLGPRLLRPIAATERPVRLAVLVMAGMHLGIDPAVVVVGLTAGVARLVVKAIQARIDRDRLSLGPLLATPKLAVPVALSMALAADTPPRDSALLSVTVVALAFGDLAALGRLLFKGQTAAGAAEPAEVQG